MPSWDELSIALQPSRGSRAPIWIGVALAAAAYVVLVFARPHVEQTVPVAPAAALPAPSELRVDAKELETERTLTFPVLREGLVVRVTNPNGSIRVVAGKPAQVVLRAQRDDDGNLGGSLAVRAALSSIDVGVEASSLLVAPAMILTLEVPAAATIELSSGHGDLSTVGIEGHQQLEAGYGKVRVEHARELRIDKSQHGDIEIVDFDGRGHSQVWAGEKATIWYRGRCEADCDVRMVTNGFAILTPTPGSSVELEVLKESGPDAVREGARHKFEGIFKHGIVTGFSMYRGWEPESERSGFFRFGEKAGGHLVLIGKPVLCGPGDISMGVCSETERASDDENHVVRLKPALTDVTPGEPAVLERTRAAKLMTRQATAQDALNHVRLSCQRSLEYALWIVAERKGLFAKEGLDVELYEGPRDAESAQPIEQCKHRFAMGAVEGFSTHEGKQRKVQIDLGSGLIVGCGELDNHRDRYVRLFRVAIRAHHFTVEHPREAAEIIGAWLDLPAPRVRQMIIARYVSVSPGPMKNGVELYERTGPHPSPNMTFVDSSVYRDALFGLARENEDAAAQGYFDTMISRYRADP